MYDEYVKNMACPQLRTTKRPPTKSRIVRLRFWRVPSNCTPSTSPESRAVQSVTAGDGKTAAARELFIERFDAYTAVINDARTPWRNLITAQADLTVAQGEWVAGRS